MNFPRRDDATNKELILTIIEIQGYLSRYGKSHTNWHETLNEVIERLERAEVQRMRGKWIPIQRGFFNKKVTQVKCDQCGNLLDLIGVNCGRGDANFCPNCGCQMCGGEEDE